MVAKRSTMAMVLGLASVAAGAVTVTERELSEGIDPIPRQSLYAGDPSGPLILEIPADLCTQQVPSTPGLPVAHPLADTEAADYRLRVATAAKAHQVRYLQRIYCRPVFDEKYANALRSVLPAACFQPPERAGLVNPAHPLADGNRSDVRAAELAHRDAVARIQALRATCREAARNY